MQKALLFYFVCVRCSDDGRQWAAWADRGWEETGYWASAEGDWIDGVSAEGWETHRSGHFREHASGLDTLRRQDSQNV